MSVGFWHVSSLASLTQDVVAEAGAEDVGLGLRRNSVPDGASGANMFRWTKPRISVSSGSLGRLRCPPRAPMYGMLDGRSLDVTSWMQDGNGVER